MHFGGQPVAHSKGRPLDLEQLESRLLLSVPVIQSVEDHPDPVEQDDLLALTARSVTDPDGGSITGVSFYHSADDVFDGAPTDPVIGAAAQIGVTDDWEWSDAATWAPGDYYYFAQATDDGEGAPGIGGNLRFEDPVVANGVWDSGEGIWADDGNNEFGPGIDTVVYDAPADAASGILGNLLLQDADASGDWTLGEAVWAEGVADGLRARAGSFWVEEASASDWTTGGERLYFGGF